MRLRVLRSSRPLWGAQHPEWRAFQVELERRLVSEVADLPTAEPGSGMEAAAARLMWEGMSPEEFAGTVDVHFFGTGLYRYIDPVLDSWVRRLDAILHMPGGIRACQWRFRPEVEVRRMVAREERRERRDRARPPMTSNQE